MELKGLLRRDQHSQGQRKEGLGTMLNPPGLGFLLCTPSAWVGGCSVLSVSLQTHGLSAWIICPYLSLSLFQYWDFSGGAVVKTPTANVGDTKYWFDPWIGKIPWRRKWQDTSVFLPGKSHGQAAPDHRVNLVTFFATHPSLLYTHPYTFCILDSCPHPWISLFPCVLS